MRRYRRNPQTVEALQWDGLLQGAEKICSWARERQPAIVVSLRRDLSSGRVLNVSIDAGDTSGACLFPGDFLIWTDGGEFQAMPQSEFNETYTELDALEMMS